MRTICSLCALMATLAGCSSPIEAPDGLDSVFWHPPALEEELGELPEGRALVERMIEFMHSHNELAVEALLTYESVQKSGQKLHFDLLQRVAFRKSENKLLWRTLRDDGTWDQGWIADGRFTMVKHPANIYAQVNGPVAVPEMVEMLTDEYGIDVPFEDLVGGKAKELWLGAEVTSIEYIGEAFVGGQWTDQIAIRRPGLDIEIWIAQGDTPHPIRIAATHTDEEGLPSFVLQFREYSTVLPSPNAVDLTIPDDARRVELAPIAAF